MNGSEWCVTSRSWWPGDNSHNSVLYHFIVVPESESLPLAALCQSESILRNCLKMYTKCSLEGAEQVTRCDCQSRLFHRKAPGKAILVLNMSVLGLGKPS